MGVGLTLAGVAVQVRVEAFLRWGPDPAPRTRCIQHVVLGKLDDPRVARKNHSEELRRQAVDLISANSSLDDVAAAASTKSKRKPKRTIEQEAERAAIRELVRAAKSRGEDLTGADGMLRGITNLEAALDEEMTDHPGYDKPDPDGRFGQLTLRHAHEDGADRQRRAGDRGGPAGP